MKKLFIFIFAGLLFFACKEEPQRTDYIINGTAKDIYNGVRVHLKGSDNKGKEQIINTVMVMNEQFTFIGQVDVPSLFNITINSVAGKLPLMIENSEINVAINKSNILESKITGSKSHNDFESYQAGLRAIENETNSIKTTLRQAANQRDVVKRDSLSKRLVDVKNEKADYTFNAIKENNDDFFSLFLIREDLKNSKIDIEKYRAVFDNLSSELKTSKVGKEIKTELDQLYIVHQKSANLEIGKMAPNFEAPTPDGDLVSLNDLKGKVTIIDFWAAWCGPCRRENPNVVKVYEKYHSQGLEIIGVSLDGARTQKNPKQSWMEAIGKDQLTWPQVSNLQYFNCPVAQLYNINSIPATYILDKDGKIVAKNLRGIALDRKVEELLQI